MKAAEHHVRTTMLTKDQVNKLWNKWLHIKDRGVKGKLLKLEVGVELAVAIQNGAPEPDWNVAERVAFLMYGVDKANTDSQTERAWWAQAVVDSMRKLNRGMRILGGR